MTRCINDPEHGLTSGVFCDGCEYRIWQELHWLADIYNPLFEALTRRMDVEQRTGHRDALKRGKQKGDLSQGIDLYPQAVTVRADIRKVADFGHAYIAVRRPELRRELVGWYTNDEETVPKLRWTARHLSTITGTRADAGRIRDWAARAVAARVGAEVLLTPGSLKKEYWFPAPGLTCSHDVGDGDGGQPIPCGGAVGFWIVDGQTTTDDLICTVNPGHTLARREAMLDRALRANRSQQAVRLVNHILGKEAAV